jgi:hypothetical protein
MALQTGAVFPELLTMIGRKHNDGSIIYFFFFQPGYKSASAGNQNRKKP